MAEDATKAVLSRFEVDRSCDGMGAIKHATCVRLG
jgi:hypothetical protein